VPGSPHPPEDVRPEHRGNPTNSLYPFAAVAMTRGDWERHYGEHLQASSKAKRRYDPANVFASGAVELFPGSNSGTL
jgi:hypothetical protein